MVNLKKCELPQATFFDGINYASIYLFFSESPAFFKETVDVEATVSGSLILEKQIKSTHANATNTHSALP